MGFGMVKEEMGVWCRLGWGKKRVVFGREEIEVGVLCGWKEKEECGEIRIGVVWRVVEVRVAYGCLDKIDSRFG